MRFAARESGVFSQPEPALGAIRRRQRATPRSLIGRAEALAELAQNHVAHKFIQ